MLKLPRQVRPRELGQGRFATGRVDMPLPNPNCPGKQIFKSSQHRRHEMREHRREY